LHTSTDRVIHVGLFLFVFAITQIQYSWANPPDLLSSLSTSDIERQVEIMKSELVNLGIPTGTPLDENCAFRVNGVSFDLTDLRSTTDYYSSEDPHGYTYRFNFCGYANEPSCAVNKGSICQYKQNGGPYVAVIGTYMASPPPSWTLLSPKVEDGVQISFSNGFPDCILGGTVYKRTAVIKLPCAPGTFVPDRRQITAVEDDEAKCLFTINFPTEVTCPGYIPRNRTGGLSNGSTFLILLLVVVPIYFVVHILLQSL